MVSQQLYPFSRAQHLGVDDADDSAMVLLLKMRYAGAAEQARDRRRRWMHLEFTDRGCRHGLSSGPELLTRQSGFSQNTAKTTYGDVQYCQTVYDVDVIWLVGDHRHAQGLSGRTASLGKDVCSVASQNQCVGDQAFKALQWLQSIRRRLMQPCRQWSQRKPIWCDGCRAGC